MYSIITEAKHVAECIILDRCLNNKDDTIISHLLFLEIQPTE